MLPYNTDQNAHYFKRRASATGSLIPTEPPTPDGFLHQPGQKSLPYIVQLPDGGCEYKFLDDADSNNRSPPPTPPMPKQRHGLMPLQKERRVKPALSSPFAENLTPAPIVAIYPPVFRHHTYNQIRRERLFVDDPGPSAQRAKAIAAGGCAVEAGQQC
ncbi:hypothetical protein BT69DRAFT_444627 [Atractiella rhizophila]|nr:hypothetical protein BT69DRAFT_444627 [Atractiella rhizophila]